MAPGLNAAALQHRLAASAGQVPIFWGKEVQSDAGGFMVNLQR